MATSGHTIVIAWRDMQGYEPTGRMIRFDGYNYKPEFAPAPMAHAVVWLNHGTADDVRQAEAHAATKVDADAVAVYVLRSDIRDPLAEAKRRILTAR